MQPIQLNRFKSLFESQINAINTLSSNSIIVDVNESSDPLDRVTVLQEQSVSDALRNRKSISIQSAQAALSRLRAGSFGLCCECEEEIDLKRLEINPTTLYCIQCQEDFEHRNQFKTAG